MCQKDAGFNDPRADALPELMAVTAAALVISSALAWLFEVGIQDRLDAWRRRAFYMKGADAAMRRERRSVGQARAAAIDRISEARYGA